MVAWAIVATCGHRLKDFCETGAVALMGMRVKYPNLGFWLRNWMDSEDIYGDEES